MISVIVYNAYVIYCKTDHLHSRLQLFSNYFFVLVGPYGWRDIRILGGTLQLMIFPGATENDQAFTQTLFKNGCNPEGCPIPINTYNIFLKK